MLGGWRFEWSVMTGLFVAGALYAVGARRSRLRQAGPAAIRVLAFYSGLLVMVAALESPIDRLADRYFWVHMLQHELLLMVAPPLVLLGRPFVAMWRVVPLVRRRQVAHRLVNSAGCRAVWRATASGRTPRAAWSLFMANFVLWHVPYAYDLTLAHPGIHVLEHALFFLTAANFWARVIPTPPIHRLRERSELVAYLAGAALLDNVFDTLFVAAPHSLYAHYANLVRAPGALSALTDQSIAGGVMNLIGSVALYGALIILLRQTVRRAPGRATPVPVSA